MKKLFVFSILLTFALFTNTNFCQKFMKYQSWASEKYRDPLPNNSHKLDYTLTNFLLKGYWNGSFDENNIPIKSLGIINHNPIDNHVSVYTIETRGYRVLDPLLEYNHSHVVNAQEGLSLEECFKDTIKFDQYGCPFDATTFNWNKTTNATYDPFTEHPTIQRWIDNGNPQKFPDPTKLQFAVSGNFIGDGKSEMMLFYYTGNSYKICLARNNSTTDALNYSFSVDSIFNLSGYDYTNGLTKFVVAGDFDNDGYDEVVILKKRWGGQNISDIYMMQFNGTQWIYNYISSPAIDFAFVVNAVPGDFDGNGVCDLACLYKYLSSNRIYLFDNGVFTTFNTKYDVSDGTNNLNFWHIQHSVAGNFDGDELGTNGRGMDELALFYDHGLGTEISGLEAVQEVLVSDHDSYNWNFTSVIKEHRQNLNFDKNLTKFALAGNFDCDIKKRDDLMTMYFGLDNDQGVMNEYKKLLLWTSLPNFAENDFIMDTLNPANLTISGKFIPVGIEGIRLQTDIISDNVFYNGGQNMIPLGYKRINSSEYINKISKLFNTILVDRSDYTDALNDYTVRTNVCDNTKPIDFSRRFTASKFDYFSNQINKGYIYALKSYLDIADQYHMKVITRMLSSHMSIYDDSIAVGTNYLARARRFWNTSQTPSFIMDNITDQSINNHHAFLGWNIFDEPDYFKLPACFPDIITYSGHFSRNPQYNNTIPLLNKPDRLSAARIMHKNYHDIVVSNTTYNNYHKPVFGNFTGNTLDFNYNYETYDIASFDVYPFGKDRTYDGLGGCVGISKSLFASAIKNNKQSTMTWLQGVGSELMDANGIPLWGTPNQYAQRFALFSQAIEGIRGFMYFMHPSMLNNDTLNASIFLATSEFNNYIPIFCKENLNYKVSTSFDRINSGDYFDWGMSKFSNDNYINYSYHYDTTANIYYLFVSNDIYFDVKDIKYTVWVDPGTPNDVYLLAPDYFKNGLYDEIYSQKNGNGGYIRFEDNISQRDIKIYTIGGLPPLNHKTIADSIGMKGSLSYSNQRKMIAYPYRQDEVFDYGSTDTVRYHAVYHHLIPNTNRYGIYYRRSNPMVRAYSQDLIDWEPNDYLISSQVFDNTSFCNYPTNCMYPSIVVRYDYTNPIPMLQKPKAYIVYTCKTCDGDVSFDNYVVENIFSANDNVQNVPASVGNVIGKIHGYDMNIFGTPTISAVYNGNIYSWSDEQRGIIAGFKQPHLTNIQNSDTLCLHWNSMNIGGEKVIALHPSVNSYSRIHLGENNCSLVWQEKDSSFNPFLPITYHQIYYTRLTYDTYLGRLIQYLPNTFSDPNWTVPVNANNTIAHLSNTGIFSNINNYIPSVYRGVEDYVQHPRPNDSLTLFQTKYDRVFWEGDYSVGPFFSSSNIYYRALDILDNPNGTPNSWLAFSPFKIWSLNYSLTRPNASQGHLTQIGALNTPYPYLNTGDSALVLNFNSNYDLSYPLSIANIWQINCSFWSFYGNSWTTMEDTIEISNSKYTHRLIGMGGNPQLAAMPVVRGRGEWLANRRIFETGINDPPEIASSVQYFYKKFNEPESAYNLFGYLKDDENGLITPIWFNDDNGLIKMPRFHTHHQEVNSVLPNDTLYTDWFKMEKFTKMNFLLHGNTSSYIVKIERQNDRKAYNVPLSFKSDSIFVNHQFKLLNSKGNKFRLLIVKVDPLAKYTENLVIGGLPSVEDLTGDIDSNKLKKINLASSGGYIDLGDDDILLSNTGNGLELSVYPNPAKNNLNIIAYKPISAYTEDIGQEHLNSLIMIRVYNALGREIANKLVHSGERISFNLEEFSQGIYFIRAEEKGVFDDIYSPATQSFVIQK